MANIIVDKFFEENKAFRKETCDQQDTSCDIFEDIDDNDEIWIMQCSKNINIKTLENQKLKLPGRTKVENLEITSTTTGPEKQVFGYCCAKDRVTMRLLPICGKILVHEKLNANDPQVEDNNFQRKFENITFKPVPQLKTRHPLLGAQIEHTDISNRPLGSEGNKRKRHQE